MAGFDGWRRRRAAPAWGGVWPVFVGVGAAGALAAFSGLPVLLALGGLLFGGWVLHAPVVGLMCVVLTQVNWLLGSVGAGSLTAAKAALGVTLVSALLASARRLTPVTYAPHMLPLGGFVLIVLLGPWLTPAYHDAMVGIGKFALMWLCYLLVANLAIDRRTITAVLIALSLTAVVSTLIALVERFIPAIELSFESGSVGLGAHLDTESLGGKLAIRRVTGGLGDANWFSYTMATVLPLSVYWFHAYRQRWVRVLAVLMGALLAAGIVFSYTRTPFVGVAAALAVLVWKRRIPVRPLLFAAALAAVTAPLWLPDGFAERFFSRAYMKEGSTPMRTEVYDMAFKLIRERPLLGFGYQRFGPEFVAHSGSDLSIEFERRDRAGTEALELLRAHNVYLDIAVLHGLVGLAFFVAFCAWMLIELNQVAGAAAADPGHREMAIALLACLVAFLVCGMGGHAQELKVLWITAGLAAGVRRSAFSAGAP